ncbi:hypothetical protein [Seonamhaeicola marinus]|uniref:Uncharacterized protein n=1 Tax=Seonamhaeicola marinus TaxID=1912246 RepID=A0A5D0HU46_9FLAO|nr:hypothetical protein [Seonamhaeicola marinus]TYA74430.1 hypothetical protein FUA24_13985 [Seonamhaeicola marinus]
MDTLSPQEVPAFMYLIDRIKYKKELSNMKIKNEPMEIANNGSYEDYHKVSVRTIRRALKLYENLLAKKVVFTDYNRPSRKTLNVLSQYYIFLNGGSKSMKSNVFDFFKDHNKKEIEIYAEKNLITGEELNNILYRSADRLQEDKIDEVLLMNCKNELNEIVLEAFYKTFNKNKKKFKKGKVDDVIKEKFVVQLNKGIEKKRFFELIL